MQKRGGLLVGCLAPVACTDVPATAASAAAAPLDPARLVAAARRLRHVENGRRVERPEPQALALAHQAMLQLLLQLDRDLP
jgi:hypothetical protein